MDPQTKKEIIAEISSTATNTVEQAFRDSLKSALIQEFLDKTIDKTIKRKKTKKVSVRGRLKQNIEFWKNELKPFYFVENIINNGYLMPFTTIPTPFYAPNNKSSLRHSQFVSQAITKLQQNNCVEELKPKPYCCNPPTVAEGKKLHLVLDLPHVNKHINHSKFYYENLSTLSEMLNKGDYFATFNLTFSYHHIEIHPEHRKFLDFEWPFGDCSTRYFQFCFLPFGLASTCYVFTKVAGNFFYALGDRPISSTFY